MSECPIAPWMRRERLRQVDVAKMLGTQQSTVSSFMRRERGLKPRLLLKLADLSGVSVKRLVTWMAEKPSAVSQNQAA